MKPVTSYISKKEIPQEESLRGDMIRRPLVAFIQQDFPGFDDRSYLSVSELNVYRQKYLESMVEAEAGELDQLESQVVRSITENKLLSENIEDDIDEKLTLGQRVADLIARFGGSWTFIIIFFSFLGLWMVINVIYLAGRAFDPYPFILLNLILSCLAAIQAPIIMMSQNRQEEKDRTRGEHDYKVNLKAELEIKMLHEKLDHLMIHQNRRLLEMQEIQTDYLEDIAKDLGSLHEKTRGK